MYIQVLSTLPLTVSANLARLNTAIVAHEQLETKFSTLKDQTENEFQFLYNENKLLKAENSHLKLQRKDAVKRLRRIKAQVSIEYIEAGDGADIENDEGELVDDSGQQSTTNVRAEKDDQQHASDDAIQSAYAMAQESKICEKCFSMLVHEQPCSILSIADKYAKWTNVASELYACKKCCGWVKGLNFGLRERKMILNSTIRASEGGQIHTILVLSHVVIFHLYPQSWTERITSFLPSFLPSAYTQHKLLDYGDKLFGLSFSLICDVHPSFTLKVAVLQTRGNQIVNYLIIFVLYTGLVTVEFSTPSTLFKVDKSGIFGGVRTSVVDLLVDLILGTPFSTSLTCASDTLPMSLPLVFFCHSFHPQLGPSSALLVMPHYTIISGGWEGRYIRLEDRSLCITLVLVP
ncbi:hypothetical protein F4604DRAFT_1685374 [Suillus subluteus]|nr:hypothetical protein F4604DRAFT_1685374 [Suillus subluteus]